MEKASDTQRCILALFGVGYVAKPGTPGNGYTNKFEDAQQFDTFRDAYEARTGMQRVIPISQIVKDTK